MYQKLWYYLSQKDLRDNTLKSHVSFITDPILKQKKIVGLKKVPFTIEGRIFEELYKENTYEAHGIYGKVIDNYDLFYSIIRSGVNIRHHLTCASNGTDIDKDMALCIHFSKLIKQDNQYDRKVRLSAALPGVSYRLED